MPNGKKTDDIVFDFMTTAADRTSVDINQLPSEDKREHSIREDQKLKEKRKKDEKRTKRLNKNWDGYGIIPEVSDELSKEGIKIRPTPALLAGMSQGRPFTLGNTIYISMADIRREYARSGGGKKGRESAKMMLTGIVKDELPHVAQYREAGGVPQFLAKYAKEALYSQGPSVLKRGGPGDWIRKLQRNLYSQKGSLEAFHYIDSDERDRLLGSIGIDFQSDVWYPGG